jgi:hypothetical protein
MSYQDPTGDTMTTGGAGVPPLLGYGADSTLNTNSGGDAIPNSMTTPPGAASGMGGMGAPEPSAAPQQFGTTPDTTGEPEVVGFEVTEVEVDALDDESWNLRRTGLIAGVVVAGLATGAGAAWFIISRRRAQRARQAAEQMAQIAQARRFFSMLPAQAQVTTARKLIGAVPTMAPMVAPVARQRLANAADTGASLTRQASQSARDVSATAIALAESALSAAQDARDRAVATSQMLRDQTLSASQVAQEKFNGTWGRTRSTAATSWDAAAQTAKVARDAALRMVEAVSEAAKDTANIARAESQRTAKVARSGWRRTQRAATR